MMCSYEVAQKHDEREPCLNPVTSAKATPLMKPDTELRIFGYLDPEPPIPGTLKAEVFRVTEQFDQSGTVPDEVIETFTQSIRNMRLKHKAPLN